MLIHSLPKEFIRYELQQVDNSYLVLEIGLTESVIEIITKKKSYLRYFYLIKFAYFLCHFINCVHCNIHNFMSSHQIAPNDPDLTPFLSLKSFQPRTMYLNRQVCDIKLILYNCWGMISRHLWMETGVIKYGSIFINTCAYTCITNLDFIPLWNIVLMPSVLHVLYLSVV